jgi:DNA-binding MarR family transcriptional regulator
LPEPEFEEIATHFRVTLGMPKSAAPTRSQARSVLAGREETTLAFLKERGKSGASVQEITNHLGVTPKTTRAALKRLVAHRLAVVVGSNEKDPQRRYFATSEVRE